MVSAGPMPGRTPIAVPNSVPTRAISRFSGSNAVANPCIRNVTVEVIANQSEAQRRKEIAEIDAEPAEDEPARHRQAGTDKKIHDQAALAEREGRAGQHDGAAQRKNKQPNAPDARCSGHTPSQERSGRTGCR